MRSPFWKLNVSGGGRGFDFRDGTNTQGLKQLRNEGTAFSLQTARPSRGSDDHVHSGVTINRILD